MCRDVAYLVLVVPLQAAENSVLWWVTTFEQCGFRQSSLLSPRPFICKVGSHGLWGVCRSEALCSAWSPVSAAQGGAVSGSEWQHGGQWAPQVEGWQLQNSVLVLWLFFKELMVKMKNFDNSGIPKDESSNNLKSHNPEISPPIFSLHSWLSRQKGELFFLLKTIP